MFQHPIRISAVVLCTAVVLVSGRVSAHHGQAGAYFLDETITLEGVVTDVRWMNPHVMVGLDVKSASGIEKWSIELSSIMTMEQGGAKQEALKTGDRIVVTGHRHRADKLLILPRQIHKPDGTTAIPVPVRRSIFGEAPQR
jgi:hypothetical protein